MQHMNRHEFLSVLAGGVSMFAAGGRVAYAAGKRNVLFIAVDDLRPQLGCYGQKHILSPHIDRLAREGLRFDRAYCQQAVCSPSRISLLSGLRPDSTGIYGNNTKIEDKLPEHVTLPQLFKRNGYETVSIGKVYHHSDDDSKGWSREPYRAEGDWTGRGYVTQEAILKMRAHEREHPDDKGRGPAFEAGDVADNRYPDGMATDFAIEQLRRLKDRPFFLAIGLYKPHLPFTAPKRYWDLYDPSTLALAENPFAPEGVTEFSLTNFAELRKYQGIPQGDDPVPDTLARQLIHGYYACVSYIDAQIGRLLDELDRLNLRNNTVVVLWGDHGWKLGEHGGWCKHTNFEIDTRVPLLISVPEMRAAGRSSEALVEYVDVYPTLAELCGLPAPANLEGFSFAPLLDDPDRPWKLAAFSQYPRRSSDPTESVMGYAIRTQNFRYIEWQGTETGRIRARELYDHRKDAAENVNVADRPELAGTVKRLSEMLKAGWRAALPRR